MARGRSGQRTSREERELLKEFVDCSDVESKIRMRQASHPSYGTRRAMNLKASNDLGAISDPQSNLDRSNPRMSGSPRSCRAGSTDRTRFSGASSKARWRRCRPARVRTPGTAGLFCQYEQSCSRKGTGSRPTRCRKNLGFGQSFDRAARRCVQPRKRRARSAERLPSLERGQTSEGKNPKGVVRMQQAWQVRMARREEGPCSLATGERTNPGRAQSREQGSSVLARALNGTKIRRLVRRGNRAGRSLSCRTPKGRRTSGRHVERSK